MNLRIERDDSDAVIFREGWKYGHRFLKQIKKHLSLGNGMATFHGILHGLRIRFIEQYGYKLEDVNDSLLARIENRLPLNSHLHFEMKSLDVEQIMSQKPRLPSRWNNQLVVIGLRRANAGELIPGITDSLRRAVAKSVEAGCTPCQRGEEWLQLVNHLKMSFESAPMNIKNEILDRLGLSRVEFALKHPGVVGVRQVVIQKTA